MKCIKCNGSGRFYLVSANSIENETIKCSKCNGTGEIKEYISNYPKRDKSKENTVVVKQLTIDELIEQFLNYMEYKKYTRDNLLNSDGSLRPVSKMRFNDYVACAKANGILHT